MLTAEELAQIPLIDTHVHRVHPNRAPEWGNLGGGYIPGPGQERNGRETVLYGMVMEALRRRFGMKEDAPLLQIEAERERRYRADPQGYYAELLSDCNVAVHCLEIGSPIGGPSYTPEEEAYFNASIPEEKRRNIVRLDRVIDELLPKELPFAAFALAYRERLLAQIAARHAVGLKSCIAYNGGLAVAIVSQAEAAACYERVRLGKPRAEDHRLLYDYLLLESMEIAEGLSLPVQIHTGLGGGSWIDFATMDPLCLIDFLQDARVKNRVRIVLLHGGHPAQEHASYLVSQFSNVYSDFSGAFYLSGVKGVDRMAALMERAPLNKLMYGSDGVMFPEVSWFAHHHFRRLLARLLNGMMDDGFLTERRAGEVARMFCYENALQCYDKINAQDARR